jgi:hypothetical protein
MKGVVGKIYSKDFGDAMAWSFTLRGDRTFYRLGNKKPFFSEGDSIQFDVEMKGQNAYARGASKWEGGEVVSSAPAAAVARSAGGPRNADDYWRAKEVRDIETQKRIELQSCRNSAIALVAELLKVEAVKLPAKQADKVPVIEELVTHYTKFFIDQNAGKEAKEEIPDAAEPIAEKNNNNEAANDDNWN